MAVQQFLPKPSKLPSDNAILLHAREVAALIEKAAKAAK
jgi:hypothetical protein